MSTEMEKIRFLLENLWTVERNDLDEGSSAKEEAKHVGHDVVTDHAGNGNDEPVENMMINTLKHNYGR